MRNLYLLVLSTAVAVTTSGIIEHTEFSYVLNVRSFQFSCPVSTFRERAPSALAFSYVSGGCKEGNAQATHTATPENAGPPCDIAASHVNTPDIVLSHIAHKV